MSDNRIVYGLLKEYGVDTSNLSPKEAWEILKDIKNGKVIPISYRGADYAENMRRDKKREEVRMKISLTFFGKKKREKSNSPVEIPPAPKEAFGFGGDRLYTDHHIQHAKDMGYKDPKKYEKAAILFWTSEKGIRCYSKLTKVFCRYDEKTREFLCIDKDGIIKTFYFLDKKKFERKVIQDRLIEI